jgi:hypothetical protein
MAAVGDVKVIVATSAGVWHSVQSRWSSGAAMAACGLMVATKIAVARPVTSTATFGMLTLFKL